MLADMTTTRTVYDGEIHVHYGQFYVTSDDDRSIPGLHEAFAGQRTGLCGAAEPGRLWLITGLHTGNVGLTAELHDEPPPPDAAWEEVVEVSFTPAGHGSGVLSWGGETWIPLPLDPVGHRVRYCARGFTAGRNADTRLEGEPQQDRYLLQFWPAPPAPDRLLLETNPDASYWHRFAQKQPPPPTSHERAEEARQAEPERRPPDRTA
jgi:hypothetical protein